MFPTGFPNGVCTRPSKIYGTIELLHRERLQGSTWAGFCSSTGKTALGNPPPGAGLHATWAMQVTTDAWALNLGMRCAVNLNYPDLDRELSALKSSVDRGASSMAGLLATVSGASDAISKIQGLVKFRIWPAAMLGHGRRVEALTQGRAVLRFLACGGPRAFASVCTYALTLTTLKKIDMRTGHDIIQQP